METQPIDHDDIQPPAEAVPAPSLAVVPDPRVALVDGWWAKHIPGMGSHLTEYLYSRLVAAVDDLKALLLELPIS